VREEADHVSEAKAASPMGLHARTLIAHARADGIISPSDVVVRFGSIASVCT
jgi:hypothetical protein